MTLLLKLIKLKNKEIPFEFFSNFLFLTFMSGHSKWSTIKHKKGIKDQRRGKLFSKIVRQIQIAARQDPDPEANSALRLTIEKAKEANMPKENIERAIKKGSGQGDGNNLEEITLEAYGPAGAAFLIEAITDNRNRTVSEIKHLLEKNGGHMADKGSVSYLFEEKIIFKIAAEDWNDEIELSLIDQGLEDSQTSNDNVLLLTNPQNEGNLKKLLQEKNIAIKSEEFDYQAKNPLNLPEEKIKVVDRLNDFLEDHDDVKAVYTNLA